MLGENVLKTNDKRLQRLLWKIQGFHDMTIESENEIIKDNIIKALLDLFSDCRSDTKHDIILREVELPKRIHHEGRVYVVREKPKLFLEAGGHVPGTSSRTIVAKGTAIEELEEAAKNPEIIDRILYLVKENVD